MTVGPGDGSQWCEHCDETLPNEDSGKSIEVWGHVTSGREADNVDLRRAFDKHLAVKFSLCNACIQELFQ